MASTQHPPSSDERPLCAREILEETDLLAVRDCARAIADTVGASNRESATFVASVSQTAHRLLAQRVAATVDFHIPDDSPVVRCVMACRPGDRVAAEDASGLSARCAELESGPAILIDCAVPPSALSQAELRIAVKAAVDSVPRRDTLELIVAQDRAIADLAGKVQARESDVTRLDQELEETNRGVIALYAELDDRAEQLKQASETKSSFLSTMSHEFRTPLASVVSLSTMLLDRMDGELTEEQEKQVTLIRSSAQELIEIVNDLLDIAKIEAGRLLVAPAWFELIELFSALRGMFRPLLNSPDVSMIFEEPGDLPSMYSDQGKIAQILRNFVSNALKFTERGEIRVSANSDVEGYIRFAVQDSGIGIPAELHEVIFEEFSQVDSPVQRRVKGTGLGLPLCRKLATLLGGTVSVESEPDRGSTFILMVPLRLDAAGARSDD